jgi:hypothetical protein
MTTVTRDRVAYDQAEDGTLTQIVSPGLLAGENQTFDRMMTMPRYSSTYIATATTTVVKSGAGTLRSITLTETAAAIITVYDNTAGSGTVIAVLKASIAEQTFLFDASFATGLTIVTAGASKLTVSWL